MKKTNIYAIALVIAGITTSAIILNATNKSTNANDVAIPSCSSSSPVISSSSIKNTNDLTKLVIKGVDRAKTEVVSSLQITKSAKEELKKGTEKSKEELFLYIFIQSYG